MSCMADTSNMASLIYYSGTMNSGKSTLALQTHYNHQVRGRSGLLYTRLDRSGEPVITSRLGISAVAVEVTPETDIYRDVTDRLSTGTHIDYLICDETQFYTPTQIDQLARLVDLIGIEVYAFGITTDFRTQLFPGTARLLELADDIITSPVPSLCWCGARGTHQARLVDGVMVMEGDLVVVGDTSTDDAVSYEVLCRKHHMNRTPRPKN